MNKKLLTVLLAAALLVAAVVSGTMAYFTDSDYEENILTLGSVDIMLNEQQRAEDDTLVDFEDNKPLNPVVPKDNVDPKDWNNYVDKIVTVTNKGANAAYVRVQIAVPADLDDNGALILDSDNDDWAIEDTGLQMVKDGITYNIYNYTYNRELAVNATTTSAIYGMYLSEDVDYDPVADEYYIVVNGAKVMLDGMDDNANVKVLVYAQAVQTDGFENAEEAFDAADFPVPGVPVADVVMIDEDELAGVNVKLLNDGLKEVYVKTLDTAYVFTATESEEEGAASEYAKWHADFVVSFDRDVTGADKIGLAGQYADFDTDYWYGAFADEAVLTELAGEVDWVDATGTIPAGAPIRLLGDIMGLTVNYAELCDWVKVFNCGAWTENENISDLTMTVELRLYEAPSTGTTGTLEVETGEYITIGTYSYTF